MNQHLFLCGMMGSGKSYFGKKLSESLNLPFIDLDQYIEEKENMSIPEIFSNYSEAFFRALELRAVTEILERPPAIIALGGGTLCVHNIDQIILTTAVLVYLKTTSESIYERIKSETHRPLLMSPTGFLLPKGQCIEKLNQLFAKRDPFYNRAHETIHTDVLSTNHVLQTLKAIYENPSYKT